MPLQAQFFAASGAIEAPVVKTLNSWSTRPRLLSRAYDLVGLPGTQAPPTSSGGPCQQQQGAQEGMRCNICHFVQVLRGCSVWGYLL